MRIYICLRLLLSRRFTANDSLLPLTVFLIEMQYICFIRLKRFCFSLGSQPFLFDSCINQSLRKFYAFLSSLEIPWFRDNLILWLTLSLRKVVTKWKWLHSSFFVLKFKPLASTTLGKNSHPLRERTISKVFVLIYIMCFLAPDKLKKTLTFLTARKCFPRARLISNININVSKLIVIQISCSAKTIGKLSLSFVKILKR